MKINGSYSVLADDSRAFSGSISNGEFRSIGNVGRTGTRVVLIVQQASDVSKGTALGWHPQIRGPGVKNDLERLTRGSDADFTIILGIHVVGQLLSFVGVIFGSKHAVRLSNVVHFTQFVTLIGQDLSGALLTLQFNLEWIEIGQSQAAKKI